MQIKTILTPLKIIPKYVMLMKVSQKVESYVFLLIINQDKAILET